MKRSRLLTGAFSMIEVVLALGLVSFALVAVLAFFPMGLKSNRASVSETRAAQLAKAIFGTIDSQCSTFSAINCYGISPPLDLASLSTMTEAPGASTHVLYASYPSPNQPVISSTASADSIYTIEMRFDNDPSLTSLTSPGTKLGAGKLSLIEIRVYSKERAEGPTEFVYFARNKG
jgi:type II secretory pathway pseudopilin PulG